MGQLDHRKPSVVGQRYMPYALSELELENLGPWLPMASTLMMHNWMHSTGMDSLDVIGQYHSLYRELDITELAFI